MNPWALCRWTGSAPPGGYTTVSIRASLPGMSASSLLISCVTFASCALGRPAAAQSTTVASPAMGIFGIRILRSSGPCGRYGWDSGLSQPGLEADLPEPGVRLRHQGALAQLRTEVARVRVGDHFPGVVARTEPQSDEFVEAKLLRPRHFEDAVQRRSHRDPANRTRDVRGRDRLEQHGWDADPVPVGRLVRDALEELEELRRPDDRVRDPRVIDQLLLGNLGAEVAALRHSVAAHDRQRDVMTHARRDLGRKKIPGRGL